MVTFNIAKRWNFVYKFTSQIGHSIFSLLRHSIKSDTTTLSNLADDANLRNASILDMSYVVNANCTITHWFEIIKHVCQTALNLRPTFRLLILWVHEQYLSEVTLPTCLQILRDYFPADWVLRFSPCHVSQFGDPIDTSCYVISVSISTHTLDFVRNVVPIGYGTCIASSSSHIVNIDNLCIPATDLKPLSVHKLHTVAILYSSDNKNVNSYSTSKTGTAGI